MNFKKPFMWLAIVCVALSSPALSEEAASPQKYYDRAFTALKQEQYDDAETNFRAFLENYPDHKLAGNVEYWLGETYFTQGKFQDAAVKFADGYQKRPRGHKAPDNLLKLAMSLGALNKTQDACAVLSELHQRFPKAIPVIRERARKESVNMGCTESQNAESPAVNAPDLVAQRKAMCQLRFSAALGAPGSNTFSGSLSRASQALADCMEGRAPSPTPQPMNCTTTFIGGVARTSCN
jgi:tol-pal system protein YbgF